MSDTNEERSLLEAMMKDGINEIRKGLKEAIQEEIASYMKEIQNGDEHWGDADSAMDPVSSLRPDPPMCQQSYGDGLQPSRKRQQGAVICYRCGEPGHIAIGCRRNIQHIRKPEKIWDRARGSRYVPQDTNQPYRCYAQSADTIVNTVDLVGTSNEAVVNIEGMDTGALLDTGSSVSTVSEAFFRSNLTHLDLHDIQGLLRVECADGNSLPYLGFVKANLSVPDLSPKPQPCLLLVVPDTQYNQRTPLLLGTNYLAKVGQDCQEQHGCQYLQRIGGQSSWYLALRCLTLREKQLSKNHHQVAVIRSAENVKKTIYPNETVTLRGFVDKAQPYQRTCALLQPLRNVNVDLDLQPSLISYNGKGTDSVDVTFSNLSTRTVTLNPRTLLCEVQPVDITCLDDTPTNVQDSLLAELDINTTRLTPDQQKRGINVIMNFEDIFSRDEADVGLYSRVKHRIEINNLDPFKQRHRMIPPSMLDEVRSHIQQLLAAGIIRRSCSPWSSNIVLARRKDGRLRLCTDFRQLNERTIKDSYALPRVEEILDCLAGSQYFTVLDMKSGYYQIEIDEQHKQRTAFTVGPLGFYEYNRLPFGLTNSPATYQRVMEEILGDLHMRACLIYLDDVIIFSRTYEEHLERLQQVFQRIRDSGLKLAPRKCKFFHERVVYVGHQVSNSGIAPDPEKSACIRDWPRPKTPEDVRRFLGFAGYYRKFVKDFAKIAAPLSSLMPTPMKKKQRGRKKIDTSQRPWTWGEPEETAFTTLKSALSSPPVLGYADFTRPFELHTDASALGLGAVLYQEQAGGKKVIAYASRSLGKAEKNYPAHKLEFLALKWAVTEKLRDYLYGAKFIVLTDNNPLTYVLTSAKLDACGHRWLAALSAFDFTLKYRAGVKNVDADTLSRLAHNPELTADQEREISAEVVHTICSSLHCPLVETLCLSTDALVDMDGQDIGQYRPQDIRRAQNSDPLVGTWMTYIRSGKRPNHRVCSRPEDNAMLRSFDHLRLKRGALYREVKTESETVSQLVLPKSLVKEALTGLHDDIGHPGRDRTMALTKERFWWPGMSKDVEDWVRHCPRCVRRKAHGDVAPLVSITTSQPLELVCIDFLSLESSSGGYQNVLVITDHFTRYAQAIPTRNQTARTTAEALFNSFITHYGFPKRLHADQGANFESRVIRELCQIAGVDKSRTTAYHPMGNGMVERFNRSLLAMLGTLEPEKKTTWHKYVPAMVHAYNCTAHDSTGFSPYYLMFGRHPRLPVDMIFGLDRNDGSRSHTAYVDDLRQRLQEAYRRASEVAGRAQERQKAGYDKRSRGATLEPGDRVLVRILAFEGKHKLANKWEEDVYVVASQPNPDVPVYSLYRETDPARRPRTLHRNHLLPVGMVPASAVRDESSRPIERERRTRAATQPRAHSPVNRRQPEGLPPQQEQPSQEDSEDDVEDYVVVQPVLPTADIVPVEQPSTDATLAPDEINVSLPDTTGDGQVEPESDEGSGDDGDDRRPEVEDGQPDQPTEDVDEDEEASGSDATDQSASEETAEEEEPDSESEPEEVEEEEEEEEEPLRRSDRNRRPPDRLQAGQACANQVEHLTVVKQKVDVLSDFLKSGTVHLESKDIASVLTQLLSEK